MCARVLRWTRGQQGVWSRVTLGTLLVPALPALGAGTLSIGGDRAVPNEMTRVTVPAVLTVGPFVRVW